MSALWEEEIEALLERGGDARARESMAQQVFALALMGSAQGVAHEYEWARGPRVASRPGHLRGCELIALEDVYVAGAGLMGWEALTAGILDLCECWKSLDLAEESESIHEQLSSTEFGGDHLRTLVESWVEMRVQGAARASLSLAPWTLELAHPENLPVVGRIGELARRAHAQILTAVRADAEMKTLWEKQRPTRAVMIELNDELIETPELTAALAHSTVVRFPGSWMLAGEDALGEASRARVRWGRLPGKVAELNGAAGGQLMRTAAALVEESRMDLRQAIEVAQAATGVGLSPE